MRRDPRRTQRCERRLRLRPGEAVEQRALLDGCEQRLVRVLTVQVDEPPSALRKLRHRREPAVDVAAGPSVGGHDPREHDLVVAVVESAFDTRLGRTFANQLRIGSPATEEIQRVDDQRLARAGLAGDHRQARAEGHLELGNDSQILDAQLGKHRLAVRKRELGLQDLMEVARPDADQP